MQRVVQSEKKIKSLEIKHAQFDELIKKESSRFSFDEMKIVKLKKKKLKIRDQIFFLSGN